MSWPPRWMIPHTAMTRSRSARRLKFEGVEGEAIRHGNGTLPLSFSVEATERHTAKSYDNAFLAHGNAALICSATIAMEALLFRLCEPPVRWGIIATGTFPLVEMWKRFECPFTSM